MSTPGKRRALRALGEAKRQNTERIARGQKPVIGGRSVSPSTYARKTGQSTSKQAARQRIAKRKG